MGNFDRRFLDVPIAQTKLISHWLYEQQFEEANICAVTGSEFFNLASHRISTPT